MLNHQSSAIIVLARGYEDKHLYKERLIRRNQSIEKHLLDKSIPLIVFHEGNIADDHQEYIRSFTPSLELVFVDVAKDGHAFRKEKAAIETECPEYPIGYRHMYHFWFVDFWFFLQDYQYVLRIDDDCYIKTNIDNIFKKMQETKIVCIYPLWVLDADAVIKNLRKSTIQFLQTKNLPTSKSPSSPVGGPYTNVVGFNLERLRQSELLREYIDHVDKTDFIYKYRHGDLPLWGEVLTYLYNQRDHRLDTSIKYFHASHDTTISALTQANPFIYTIKSIMKRYLGSYYQVLKYKILKK